MCQTYEKLLQVFPTISLLKKVEDTKQGGLCGT